MQKRNSRELKLTVERRKTWTSRSCSPPLPRIPGSETLFSNTHSSPATDRISSFKGLSTKASYRREDPSSDLENLLRTRQKLSRRQIERENQFKTGLRLVKAEDMLAAASEQ